MKSSFYEVQYCEEKKIYNILRKENVGHSHVRRKKKVKPRFKVDIVNRETKLYAGDQQFSMRSECYR